MLGARLSAALIVVFFCVCSQAEELAQKITVTGKPRNGHRGRIDRLGHSA
jgi:hypothetical protein